MTARELIAQFRRLRVLVVGDVCLDLWAHYDPAQALPSRETGLPRIAVLAAERTPGAGGTVANNLAALGVGRVRVAGVIGRDGHGLELRNAMAARGIDTSSLVESEEMQTFTYTKLLNRLTGEEDLPRVDWINLRPLPAPAEAALLDVLRVEGPAADVTIVSDQAETDSGGVVTAAVRAELGRLAAAGGNVWVDSRRRIELYRDAYLKPNEDEAADALVRTGWTDCEALRRETRSPGLVVTHGAEGAQVYDASGSRRIAGRRIEHPVDICGAGDSFSAAAACVLALTGDLAQAARWGNLAASLTILQRGTGTARAEDLLAIAE